MEEYLDSAGMQIFNLSGVIDHRAGALSECFQTHEASQKARAVLLIDSPGGYSDSAEQINEVLGRPGLESIAYVPQKAGSMAAVLGLAANIIVVTPQTLWTFHAEAILTSSKTGGSLEISEMKTEWILAHLTRCLGLIALAPKELRSTLSGRFAAAMSRDKRAGFRLSGTELAQIALPDRTVILCQNMRDMALHCMGTVSKEVFGQEAVRGFWGKFDESTL